MTMATTPDELDDAGRRALETLIVSIADDEFVIAERYTEWQVRAPSLESDLALANIAQDELGHARLWYDVLGDLGYKETDLLYERDPADFRQSTLCELSFEPGDWADPIVRSYLFDTAESIRLEALADSSYKPIATRVPKISAEEDFHLDHATAWLERLVETDTGRSRVQAALDRLYPHACSLFEPALPPRLGSHTAELEPAAVESTIVECGLRPVPLADLQTSWFDTVSETLSDLELTVPDGSTPPEATGRNGRHTDDWFELHEDFTHTYRELGRTDTTRIMATPDDA